MWICVCECPVIVAPSIVPSVQCMQEEAHAFNCNTKLNDNLIHGYKADTGKHIPSCS